MVTKQDIVNKIEGLSDEAQDLDYDNLVNEIQKFYPDRQNILVDKDDIRMYFSLLDFVEHIKKINDPVLDEPEVKLESTITYLEGNINTNYIRSSSVKKQKKSKLLERLKNYLIKHEDSSDFVTSSLDRLLLLYDAPDISPDINIIPDTIAKDRNKVRLRYKIFAFAGPALGIGYTLLAADTLQEKALALIGGGALYLLIKRLGDVRAKHKFPFSRGNVKYDI